VMPVPPHRTSALRQLIGLRCLSSACEVGLYLRCTEFLLMRESW
jgi:hypothetical protein